MLVEGGCSVFGPIVALTTSLNEELSEEEI